jgi:hypothetical protein
MSEENHPNINAAGFITEVIVAFRKHLRGKANLDEATKHRAFDILERESGLQDFVVKVSENLDNEFGV